MKKRLLSALLSLCMVLTMVPAAFAADLPTPTGLQWGELNANYTGICSIAFRYEPNESVAASGVYLDSGSHSFILTGANDSSRGGATVWPDNVLIPRIVDTDSSEWVGEYGITLFVTSDTSWIGGTTLDTASTVSAATEYKLKLETRAEPTISEGTTVKCTWETGDFGAYSDRLTLDFDGQFEPG